MMSKKTINERLTILEHDILGNGAKGLKEQVAELKQQLDENAREDKAVKSEMLGYIKEMTTTISEIKQRQQYFAGGVAAASIFISIIIGLIINNSS